MLVILSTRHGEMLPVILPNQLQFLPKSFLVRCSNSRTPIQLESITSVSLRSRPQQKNFRRVAVAAFAGREHFLQIRFS